MLFYNNCSTNDYVGTSLVPKARPNSEDHRSGVKTS